MQGRQMETNRKILWPTFYIQMQFLGLVAGVDVMITIFCDFCQFSAKNLAFFAKSNVMITIFAKTSSGLSKKRQYFR
jgi:hypothetical protein